VTVTPIQLEYWRFILLTKGSKIPTKEMKGWANDRENRTFKADSPTLENHTKNGGNYAVITGEDRIVLGSDTKEIEKAIEERLPKTFSVRSPRHKTKHFYYYCHVTGFVQFKPTADGDPCCDLKYGNAYVVGANSILEGFGAYEVADDVPIATITEEQIRSALDDFIIKHEATLPKEEADKEGSPEFEFPIGKLLESQIESMTQRGKEIRGIHPKHGSTTGGNFSINIEKNSWHCFRHHVGGHSLQLFAVINGIINCEDKLKGENFKKAVELAYEKGFLAEKPKLFSMRDSQWIVKEGKTETPNTEAILEYFNEKHAFATANDTEEIYYYRKGQYLEAEIMVKTELEIMLGSLLTTHYTNEILDHIRRKTYTPRSYFNKYLGRIPVENGLLNLETFQLEGFTEKEIYTFKIKPKFDPDRTAPNFQSYLDTSLPEKDKQRLLQEYCGYCLLPSMPYAKVLLLYGEGRNGKDRLVKTLEFILGNDNTSYIPLEDLDGFHRFSIANLYGKLLNICSEPATDKPLSTEIIKKATGENIFDAEKKNIQKPIKFMNIAKFIVEGNKYPPLDDDTVAMKQRLALIKWEKQFLEGDPNTIPNIEKTWLGSEDELSGILNWMLVGLARLLKNKAFTSTTEFEELLTEYERISNPLRSFMKEPMIVFDFQAKTRGEPLYECYKNYCLKLKVKPEGYVKFNNFINTIPKVVKTRDKEGIVWTGLAIRQLDLQEGDDVTNVTNAVFLENKKFLEKEKNKKDENTTSLTSVTSTVLERLESYMTLNKEVGKTRVCQDLGITEDQLKGLMGSTSILKWSMNGQTIIDPSTSSP